MQFASYSKFKTETVGINKDGATCHKVKTTIDMLKGYF